MPRLVLLASPPFSADDAGAAPVWLSFFGFALLRSRALGKEAMVLACFGIADADPDHSVSGVTMGSGVSNNR
jgi:hypothetical protein